MKTRNNAFHPSGCGDIVVSNPRDGFTWISRPHPLEDAELPPHRFASMPAATKAARSQGFDPTHWIDPEQGPDARPVSLAQTVATTHEGIVNP